MPPQLTVQQRAHLVRLYYAEGSTRKAAIEFQRCNPSLGVPHPNTVIRAVRKHIELGNQANQNRKRTKSDMTEETSEAVLAMFVADPHLSLRQASAQAGPSYGSVQKLLKSNNWHPHKIPVTTIDGLKERITNIARSISVETLEKVRVEFLFRLTKCIKFNGEQFEHRKN